MVCRRLRSRGSWGCRGRQSSRLSARTNPPRYERRTGPASFTPFEARVRLLLTETPEMPATVLADRVGGSGRSGGSGTTSPGCGLSIARLIRRTG